MVILMVGICTVLYSEGLNFQGNGSKAIAMGGAFVGLADDHSAIFWNPAGLTQLEQISLSMYFGAYIFPNCSYKLNEINTLNIDALGKPKFFTGTLSYLWNKEKRVRGLAFTSTSLGVEWKGSELKWLTNGKSFEWEAYGRIYALSYAEAYKISHTFSVGATIDANLWLANLNMPGLPLEKSPHPGQYTEDTIGGSLGLTLGVLVKPVKILSIGLALKLPRLNFSIGRASLSDAHLLDPNMPPASSAERIVRFPLWIGLGMALKPTERLTITADVQYTNWDDVDTIKMKFSKPEWKTLEEKYSFKLEWDDCFQLRFGMEYKFSSKVALRLGYYHDPNPGPKMSQTILLPVHEFNFITVGAYINILDFITIDLGVPVGFGEDVVVSKSDLKAGYPGMDGTHAINPVIFPTITITFNF